MNRERVIGCAAVAAGLLLVHAGPAAGATSTETAAAQQPYALEDAKRFVVQGRRDVSAAGDGLSGCRLPRASLSLAPHERAVELRQLSLNPRTCRATFERGVPPRWARDRALEGELQDEGSRRGRSAGGGVGALASGYRWSGYAKAWYWDRRSRRVVNSVRSGADWNSSGACIGTNNVWFRNFADTATGWFQVSRRWSYVNNACDHVISSTDARFRDRRFTGCSDGPVVDTHYRRVRFVGYPNGGQRASRTSRVEPSCRNRLTAYFALYRGQAPSGP